MNYNMVDESPSIKIKPGYDKLLLVDTFLCKLSNISDSLLDNNIEEEDKELFKELIILNDNLHAINNDHRTLMGEITETAEIKELKEEKGDIVKRSDINFDEKVNSIRVKINDGDNVEYNGCI